MAGSDIRAGSLTTSGYITKHRARLRALDVVGTASAGLLYVFDTDTTPLAGTYVRSGTTVTVTDADHALQTGDVIGIAFAAGTGGSASAGNYRVTVVNSSTFTITDINTGTITGDPACSYVHSSDGQSARWLATFRTAASDTFFNGFNVPDEGILAKLGIYVQVANLASVNIYHS